jgi:hypothetical protein
VSLPCGVSGLEHGRQAIQQRIEGLGIAGEIAADEPGRDRSIAAVVDDERQLAAGHAVERLRRAGIGAHSWAAREDMRIALGKDDDLASFDRDRLLADDIGEAASFNYHVIRDEMPAIRQDLRQYQFARWRLGHPRRPARAVEERRAREPHRLQDVR